jgi:hypothetical protein
MNASQSYGLTVEQVQEMVRRELSTPKRVGYALLGMLTLTAAGLIGTLWWTEPEPLPLRTQVAFGLLMAINVAWSVFCGWVVTRRKVLFAVHSVIAGWMAVAFCSLFLLMGLAIVLARANSAAVITVGVLGFAQLLVATLVLRNAQWRRSALLARRDELAMALQQRRQVC